VLNTKQKLCLLLPLVIGFVFFLPLEKESNGFLSIFLLLGKSSALFLCISVLVISTGHSFLVLLKRILSTSQYESVLDEQDDIFDTLFHILFSGLCGVLIVGLMIFCLGLVFAPTSALAAFIVIVTSMPAFYSLSSERPLGLLCDKLGRFGKEFTLGTKVYSNPEKAFAAFGMLLIAGRIMSCFTLPDHGDGYLYHLSASDAWMAKGKTGVFLDNFYSGYALGVEHFYLFLRLLGKGEAEQTVLAQLFHYIFGFGTFCFGAAAITKGMLTRFSRQSIVFALQAPLFSTFALLPKNDAFLAGSLMAALVSVFAKKDFLFIAACAFAFLAKPTAAITNLSLGLTLLLCGIRFRSDLAFKKSIHLLIHAVLLLLLLWSPFAIHNFVLTGNPLFPLANELFRSPFVPLSLSDVVIEMRPFSLTFMGWLASWKEMFLAYPLFWTGLPAASFVMLFKKEQSASLQKSKILFLLCHLILSFFLIQLLTGTYTRKFEARHFLIPLSIALIISAVSLEQLLVGKRKRVLLVVVTLAIIAGGANLEVHIKNMVRFLNPPGQTEKLLERKPLLWLNNEISNITPHKRNTLPERVLALSIDNTPYFLKGFDFWHYSESYPVWTWDVEAMKIEDLQELIFKHRIRYIIVSGDRPTQEAAFTQLPHERVLERKNYAVLKMY
jgi:hypothetical protein